MGLIAGSLSAAASWYYPWPDSASAQLGAGQGLFKPFEASRVWSLDIAAFVPETQTVERFSLKRQGDRWLVPTQAGFPSDNIARRTAIINAVVNLTDPKGVLQQKTDSQQDHVEYGVVDPAELQEKGSRAGVGTRVVLEDRNRQTLATLIVGSTIEGQPGQAFVRIPGQPQVYLVEFVPQVLSVSFGDWLDVNLFQLRTQARPDGELTSEIDLVNSAAGNSAFESAAPSAGAWRAQVVPAGNSFATQNMEILAGDSWTRAVLPTEINNTLVNAVKDLGAVPTVEVRAKDKELGESIAANPLAGPAELYASLNPFGFRQTAEPGQPLSFESSGGKVQVVTDSGIATTMYLGNLFSDSKTDSNLARLAMFHSALDLARFPEPQAPVAAGGVDPTDEQRREFNRQHEAWTKKLDAAKAMVSALNGRHGRWFYMLDENVVSRFLPTLPKLEPVTPPAVEATEDTPSADAGKSEVPPPEKVSAGDGNS